jgi:hypothetical protein
MAIEPETQTRPRRKSNVPMTLPELMLAEYYRPLAASCSFVELDDGRVFHASKGVRSYSEDGGLSWSGFEMMVRADGQRLDCGGSALTRLSGRNEVLLVSPRRGLPHPETVYAARRPPTTLWCWRSSNGGVTWSEPSPVTPPDEPVWCMTDTLVRLSSGRIILPVYAVMGQTSGPDDRTIPRSGRLLFNQFAPTTGHQYDPHLSYAFFVFSDDEGRTWNRNQDGELLILRDWSGDYSYVNEGSVAEVAPGRLLCFFRTGMGRLYQAWSNDNGETWTRPQPTVLASSTSTPQLRKLPTGHLLAIWDQDSDFEIRAGLNQMRLSAAISRDGGRVWEFFQNIEAISEVTRVEPGPIRPVRQEEIYFPAGRGAAERDPAIVLSSTERIHVKPSATYVMKDRVLVSYVYSRSAEHPTEARYRPTAEVEHRDPESGKFVCSKLKVLPLEWFYGGKKPCDNPYLREAYEPAKP